MNRATRVWAGALIVLACVGTVRAHHSGSMYDTAPVWITGRVVAFEPSNPHTVTMLEATSADGQPSRWAIEGPGQSQLGRMNAGMDVPAVGQVITVCAFPYRSVEELSRMFPEADFSSSRVLQGTDGSSPRYVAGHVMLMPDGEWRLWEPHGLISACVLSSGIPRESWVGFLSTNDRARRLWCEQRRYSHVRSTASLQALVEELNSAIADPCP